VYRSPSRDHLPDAREQNGSDTWPAHSTNQLLLLLPTCSPARAASGGSLRLEEWAAAVPPATGASARAPMSRRTASACLYAAQYALCLAPPAAMSARWAGPRWAGQGF